MWSKIIGVVVVGFILMSSARTQQQTTIPKKQNQSDKTSEEIQREIELSNLIFDAKSQQGEISADFLIRLIESGKIKDKRKKFELLEEAFRKASEAQYPAKIQCRCFTTDTRWSRIGIALSVLGTSRLSLQCRAVKALLQIDKKKALNLFSEISPRLSLPSLGCKKGFRYYDVSEFYNLLDEILISAFDEKQLRRNEHIQFVMPYITNITSPVQVLPLIKTISSIKTDNVQMAYLISTFAQSLKNISSDDYAFRSSMSNYEGNIWSKKFSEFIKLVENKRIARNELLQAIRGYLLSQLNGTRCSDGLKPNTQNPTEAKYALPKYIEAINEGVLTDNPIKANEINPSDVEQATTDNEFYSSIWAMDWLDRYRRIRFHNGLRETPFADEEKESPQWQADFNQLLNELVSRLPTGDISDEDYFHLKFIHLLAMLEIVPKSNLDMRGRLFLDMVSFLSSSQMQQTNPTEWLLQTHYLLEIISSAKGQDRAKLQEILNDKGNSTMKLYIKLKTLSAPQKPSP